MLYINNKIGIGVALGNKGGKDIMKIKVVMLLVLISFLGMNSYSKIISVNLTHKIQTQSEPILVKGKIINSTKNVCSIRVLSETCGGDILKLNQRCPKDVKKRDIVFGLFDGKSFMFLKRRR